jgi:Uma2 family endonuclease
MSANVKPRYSLADYLELERTSEEKWEWFSGEVFCMSGVSPTHGLIESNLNFAFGLKLRDRNCRIFPADVRIKTPAAPPYRYADLSVISEKPHYEAIGGIECLTNPEIVVQVLSPSTEAYDRGDKFTYYKSIPSFKEYLLVAQHRPHLTLFVKKDGAMWNQTEVNDPRDSVWLPSLDCTIALSEIYRGVEFGSATPAIVSPKDLL